MINCFSYTTENGTDIILNDRKQNLVIISLYLILLILFFSLKKTTYYMTGPEGIGKSSTLIYFASLKIVHIFYINFNLIFKQKLENVKKMLKYEIMIFYIGDYKDNKEINDLINEFDCENLQIFLSSLAKIFLDYYGYNR